MTPVTTACPEAAQLESRGVRKKEKEKKDALYDRRASLFFRGSSVWELKTSLPNTDLEESKSATRLMIPWPQVHDENYAKKRPISDDLELRGPVIQKPFSPKKRYTSIVARVYTKYQMISMRWLIRRRQDLYY